MKKREQLEQLIKKQSAMVVQYEQSVLDALRLVQKIEEQQGIIDGYRTLLHSVAIGDAEALIDDAGEVQVVPLSTSLTACSLMSFEEHKGVH